MIYILKFIAAWLLPPGLFILMAAVLTYYLYKQKAGRIYKLALALTLGLYFCSTTLGARLLALPLEHYYKPQNPWGIDLIVVLGGGSVGGVYSGGPVGNVLKNATAGSLTATGSTRLLTAARQARKHHVPVLITGGQVFADGANEAELSANILRDLGLPEEQIIVEPQARTTQENAEYTAKICEERGYKSVLLVTSAMHMPRSKYFFNRYVDREKTWVYTYPCDYTLNPNSEFSVCRFVPQLEAFSISCSALHEYVGLIGGCLR